MWQVGDGDTTMRKKKNQRSIWNLFGHYLHDRQWHIGFFIITILIFLVVLNLNHLHYFSEIFYAVVISGFLLLISGIYDFVCYVAAYHKLYYVLQNPEEIYARLPENKGLLQEMYAEIIWEMDERRKKLLSTLYEQEKERKDYYGMWVHQIKTPIQAARLLLERDEIKGLEAAKGLEEEIFKTEQYVEMVLYYLRSQSMSDDLLLKEYDLSTMVKLSVKKYALLFIHNNLSVHIDTIEVSVLTDEKWFGFVLEQLLSNAVKYTKQGGISIYQKKECKEYQGMPIHACLVIEDSGIGIREEDLPRIFEKGFTGFNGRLDRKSTGIGLYLCKEILKKLAIPIQVESEAGTGTKVSLYFQEKRKVSADSF